nr:MAG TPA: hypothetical protein [Caudoviricetes sp.]
MRLIHFSYNDYNYYSIYFLFCVSNGVEKELIKFYLKYS